LTFSSHENLERVYVVVEAAFFSVIGFNRDL
jgi:hypothetical protein